MDDTILNSIIVFPNIDKESKVQNQKQTVITQQITNQTTASSTTVTETPKTESVKTKTSSNNEFAGICSMTAQTQNLEIMFTYSQTKDIQEKIKQKWETINSQHQTQNQSQNLQQIEEKQKVHTKYQSSMSYAPNLTNQGFFDFYNPSQFKSNQIEALANPTQRLFIKCTMRNNLTMCQQYSDPDEMCNGFKFPDPQYDFCLPHQQMIASANQYLYQSEEGQMKQVNIRISIKSTYNENDTYQQQELKKYQEFKSIMDADIPIQQITRQHPTDFRIQKSQVSVDENAKTVLMSEKLTNPTSSVDLYQLNIKLLLSILYKKPVYDKNWQDQKQQLLELKVNRDISLSKQQINIVNIFCKRESLRGIKDIALEIQKDNKNMSDLKYILSNKGLHKDFMEQLAFQLQNKSYSIKNEHLFSREFEEIINQQCERLKLSNGYFSYDEGQICSIFYELATLNKSSKQMDFIDSNYNYLPIVMLNNSGSEQKWLVIDLKADQSKLNEYDSDEDDDSDEAKKQSKADQSKQVQKGFQKQKLKVLSIYTKETNGQFSKHKEAAVEIKGGQKCAYNIDSTTIATNYYQFSFEKMRHLSLKDDELVTIMYLAFHQLQLVFKQGFHFMSLNPKNIFLHIKTTGSQKFGVKFHFDSSCYKPAQYYNPTFTPGFIQQNLIPNSYDDISNWRLQTLYSLCMSLLQIITPNYNDVYKLDSEAILNMSIKVGNERKKIQDVYPNFCFYLKQIIVYYSTDQVDVLVNNIRRDLFDRDRRRFDPSILLHNKFNMQKVIDLQIQKFQKIVKEFYTPKRIYDRILFFFYTNQYQTLNQKGEVIDVFPYVGKQINLLEKVLLSQQNLNYPPRLNINLVSFYLMKILLYQFSDSIVEGCQMSIRQLDKSNFNENQLNQNFIGKKTIRFQLTSSNKVEQPLWIILTENQLKENLVNKFIIQILKEKPKACDKYAANDIPSKIKLKLNERRFTEVQTMIEDYYKCREQYREGIQYTPIKLTFYEEMINCRIGTKRMSEAYLWTNECFELRLSLFGWENVESANGCNSVGYVLFYLRKIKESQAYVEQAIFWSVTYKGTDNAELATAYNNIAYLVMNNNEVENSLRYHYKALKIRKQLHPKGHNDLGSTYNNIGQNLTRLKKNNESLIYYQKAMNVWIRLMGYKHNTVSLALSNIANTYTAMGKYDHSIIFHRISYLVRYQTLKQDSIDSGQLTNEKSFVQINNHDLAITLDNIGFTYTKQEKYEEAIKIQELGKRMWKELNSRNKTHLQSFVVSLNNLCNTHKKQGNYDQAFIEVYETKKILEESNDANLTKTQVGYIRQIKAEINRYAIQTLRQVNQYLQVNQSDSAIALLFKIAFLYDQILAKIQLVDNLTKKELNDPLKLPIIRNQPPNSDPYQNIFPYMVLYKNQTTLVKLPPRCYNSNNVDLKEKEIQEKMKQLFIEQQKSSQQQDDQQKDDKTEKEQKQAIQKFIQAENNKVKAAFEVMKQQFSNIQQLIMILLIQSIGDILFDKIIKKLMDNDFFKQSKEILTELKYILDAHITQGKNEINQQFLIYKKLFSKR